VYTDLTIAFNCTYVYEKFWFVLFLCILTPDAIVEEFYRPSVVKSRPSTWTHWNENKKTWQLRTHCNLRPRISRRRKAAAVWGRPLLKQLIAIASAVSLSRLFHRGVIWGKRTFRTHAKMHLNLCFLVTSGARIRQFGLRSAERYESHRFAASPVRPIRR